MKARLLAATIVSLGFVGLVGFASAKETIVKKTLDGRCLAPDHKDYWNTKVYVAKPSMEACLKSGGRRG